MTRKRHAVAAKTSLAAVLSTVRHDGWSHGRTGVRGVGRARTHSGVGWQGDRGVVHLSHWTRRCVRASSHARMPAEGRGFKSQGGKSSKLLLPPLLLHTPCIARASPPPHHAPHPRILLIAPAQPPSAQPVRRPLVLQRDGLSTTTLGRARRRPDSELHARPCPLRCLAPA